MFLRYFFLIVISTDRYDLSFFVFNYGKLLIRYSSAMEGKAIDTYEKIQLLIMECTLIFANHLSIDELISVIYSYNHSYYRSSSCGNKCEQFNFDYLVFLTNFSIYSNSGLFTSKFDTIGENLQKINHRCCKCKFLCKFITNKFNTRIIRFTSFHLISSSILW